MRRACNAHMVLSAQAPQVGAMSDPSRERVASAPSGVDTEPRTVIHLSEYLSRRARYDESVNRPG